MVEGRKCDTRGEREAEEDTSGAKDLKKVRDRKVLSFLTKH